MLSHEDRELVYELDTKMVTMLLGNLLTLGRGRLGEKHRWRIILELGLSSLCMEIDVLFASRVSVWMESRRSTNAKSAYHVNESLLNILILPTSHLLSQELSRRALESLQEWENRRHRIWEGMLRDSRGTSHSSGDRQVLAQGIGLNESTAGGGESILDDLDVAADLKKTVMWWSIYRFPVKYQLT